MTDKITLANIASFQNDTSAVAAYNANNAAITTAINNTLSRDGTSPNQMNASLDMNSNIIYNTTNSIAIHVSGVNLNSVGDTTITIPSGVTDYRLQAVILNNASRSLTTAQAAIYTAASAGGVALVNPASLTALTSSTANTAASALALTAIGTIWVTVSTLYFRCTTPQGSATTVDVTIFLQPLS